MMLRPAESAAAMTEDRVRVRFAPSPTGYLHIGGARTALFNYLFARHQGGDFLLRIEDTDLERSSEAMIERIREGMSWLGMHADEETVLQSRHREEHRAAAERMLNEGRAYRCFCSRESLDAEREAAEKAGRPYRYSGQCRGLSTEEISAKLAEGLSYTVRLKVPQEGKTRFKDMVYKNIEVMNSEIDDFILLRSDGSPVYQLAVVVDDARMGITHVIRGEDHLSNTPKQILICLALGYRVPRFAHLPLILGPDGKRLSKRFGASSVEEFRDMGFIPEGVLNALALLGWSHPSNQTLFDMETLIRDFDFSRVNKKGAIFDIQKMMWINGQHLSLLPADRILSDVEALWRERGLLDSEAAEDRDRLLAAADLLKQRMRLLPEFADFGLYLFRAPESYDTEGQEKQWPDRKLSANRLSVLRGSWQALPEFTAEAAEEALRASAEQLEEKAAVLIHSMRLAVTGFTVSPDIFSILIFLGRDEVLSRLERAENYLRTEN